MYSFIHTAFEYYKGGQFAVHGNGKEDSTQRCVTDRQNPHRSGSAIVKGYCWHSVKSDADFIHVNNRSSGNSDWLYGGGYAMNEILLNRLQRVMNLGNPCGASPHNVFGLKPSRNTIKISIKGNL